jgi:hypothetical protein
MANNTVHFSLEKVKALRAYFLRLRNGSRGKMEFGDHDTALKLCEQLLALMEPARAEKASREKTA